MHNLDILGDPELASARDNRRLWDEMIAATGSH